MPEDPSELLVRPEVRGEKRESDLVDVEYWAVGAVVVCSGQVC